MADRVRSAVIGAAVLGLAGGLLGLVVGLRTYPPTAWAAVFEVGLPAACVGAAGGLAVDGLARAVRRAQQR